MSDIIDEAVPYRESGMVANAAHPDWQKIDNRREALSHAIAFANAENGQFDQTGADVVENAGRFAKFLNGDDE